MQISSDLIKACISQERKAQKQLYELLLSYLRAVANRYLRDISYSKDVLQESFVKIFKNIGTYNAQLAPCHQWAARIVINTCINYNQRVSVKSHEELTTIHNNIPITSETIRVISDEYLLFLLKQMPNEYFEVFNLFVIDDYSHQEIAEFLNINEALSRKRLSRAKEWLRDAFQTQADNTIFRYETKQFFLN
jgi:RNA polymerase sigma-70 factor (ECF subfamily)